MPKINAHMPDPPEFPTATDRPSLISSEKLWLIYVAMIKCRMLGQHSELLLQQGKIAGRVHGAVGREGSTAAFVIGLQREDVLSLPPGDWMPALVKGMPLDMIVRALIANPSMEGGENSAALREALANWNILTSSPTAEDQLMSACAAAQSRRDAKTGGIAMAIFRDHSDARGSSQHAIALAGSRKLPIIFVRRCDAASDSQNPPTTRGPRAASPAATISGVPVMVVDGNDAVALYRVACEAITRARQERGPTFVETFSPDCSVSASLGANCIYKGKEHRNQQDPLLNMENYLRSKGLFSDELKRQSIADFSGQLDLVT